MIFPERMVPLMEEITHGRVTPLSLLQKLIITKYCLNSLETYGNTFPFISQEDDLIDTPDA